MQERVSDPLELELQEAVSLEMWMLGIELQSFTRVAIALKCRSLLEVGWSK